MKGWAALTALALTSCSNDHDVPGQKALIRHVEHERVGQAPDHWIEMLNLAGEWERTGLIFGYLDDYDVCQQAITGLKQANSAREYRCVPAN